LATSERWSYKQEQWWLVRAIVEIFNQCHHNQVDPGKNTTVLEQKNGSDMVPFTVGSTHGLAVTYHSRLEPPTGSNSLSITADLWLEPAMIETFIVGYLRSPIIFGFSS
jgi:hypothetical protein